ncbi:hypothetical protein [Noviluteimonas dokdonensis]|uniref:hypothetical protein n=1 Tax=Noviluteimonas dokdonensis TaxID=414050 RepID=UPI00056226C1|nr:hypothetical protein [Lysobacter dokdonensis]
MTDRFADVEEPRSRIAVGILAAVLIVGVFLLFRWSGSEPRRLVGVVESTGSISVAKIQGGTREEAAVRLADGTLVLAHVVSGGPLSEGDRVLLLKAQRPLGGPVYQVVGKESHR